MFFMESRETQIAMVKWTNAGGQTKRANERSFVYRPPARRWWRNVKTTYNIADITGWREDMNFIFEWQNIIFTHSLRSFVKYCFCHEKIKFISSSRRVIFFLLYRQKDIDKIIEGNDRDYVIDKLTCEIMENKPLGSGM